jgi:hypothetical protein
MRIQIPASVIRAVLCGTTLILQGSHLNCGNVVFISRLPPVLAIAIRYVFSWPEGSITTTEIKGNVSGAYRKTVFSRKLARSGGHRKLQVWRLDSVSEKVTTVSLWKFYNAINVTGLRWCLGVGHKGRKRGALRE